MIISIQNLDKKSDGHSGHIKRKRKNSGDGPYNIKDGIWGFSVRMKYKVNLEKVKVAFCLFKRY